MRCKAISFCLLTLKVYQKVLFERLLQSCWIIGVRNHWIFFLTLKAKLLRTWRDDNATSIMVIFFLIIFLSGSVPSAIAQFSEAGVQKLRVAVDAPDFTLKEVGG
jgi:uncharacterized integral membrane protein